MKLLLGRHELAYINMNDKSVYNRIFNHTNRISVANFQLWTVHKIIEYLTLVLNCLDFEISITVQWLTFLTHPIYTLSQIIEKKWK